MQSGGSEGVVYVSFGTFSSFPPSIVERLTAALSLLPYKVCGYLYMYRFKYRYRYMYSTGTGLEAGAGRGIGTRKPIVTCTGQA